MKFKIVHKEVATTATHPNGDLAYVSPSAAEFHLYRWDKLSSASATGPEGWVYVGVFKNKQNAKNWAKAYKDASEQNLLKVTQETEEFEI